MGALEGQEPRQWPPVIDFSFDDGGLVLALGAHSDDIEIAAGGTMLRLAAKHPGLRFRFAVATSGEGRRDECIESARRLLGDRVEVEVADFRDGFLPYDDPAGVKDWLLSISSEAALVFTPSQEDSHQDHRLLGELCWQVFRRRNILEYELPKWESQLFRPNLYVPLSAEITQEKLDHLDVSFPSQHGKSWYTRELFHASLLARGVQHGASKYAEAFLARAISLTGET